MSDTRIDYKAKRAKLKTMI